jgi:hypothetical protein
MHPIGCSSWSNMSKQCDTCGYYAMLDEKEATEGGFFFPAVEPAPRPQQEQLYANALQALIFGGPPNDDAFMNPSAPFQPLPMQPQHTALPSKPKCSIPRCKRVAASECGLCKACCEGRGIGCGSSKHRSGPPRKKQATSFTPQRPAAISPPFPTPPDASSVSMSQLTLPVSSAPLPTTLSEPSIAPRSFREDMSREWAAEWKAREKGAEERRAAAELRKRNELAIARQVVIQLWREVRL